MAEEGHPENADPSQAAPPDPSLASPTAAVTASLPLVHPRREPFEYGLLPIPKLIFTDGTGTLATLKQKFLEASPAGSSGRVDAPTLSEVLQIPTDHAALVIDTLEAVHPRECHAEVPAGTTNVLDLLLFLYVQTYKKLVQRSYKESVAAAEVWPSNSAFDGLMSALSPIQLVRSNSRRFMPSQADEEAHRLSYLQQHMANMLYLLADPAEEQGDDSLLLTEEKFEHLGLLIQFGDTSEGSRLSQSTPFYAKSEAEMPMTPVPIAQVEEWISQKISASLKQINEKASAKEPQDSDASMADASASQARSQSPFLSGSNTPYSRNQTFIEGVTKVSIVKKDIDIRGDSLKVLNCYDSIHYILAPLRYATIYGCSDATIVIGAVGKVVRVEHCERMHIITAAKRVCISNCRECIFYLAVNQRPLFLGENLKLQVAPYNTFYSQLNDHMMKAGIDPTINRWDEPLVLGSLDPHDSLSHPGGVSDVQAQPATCLDPELFTKFLIPSWYEDESTTPTQANPFSLPDSYATSVGNHNMVLKDVLKDMRDLNLEDDKKRELACALHLRFKDWLYASGNIRQLYCIQGD